MNPENDEMMFADQVQSGSDSFELNEDVVNEINNDQFEGDKLSNEQMTDALLAVDTIADAVIEKQGGGHAEVDPEQVLTQVEEIVNGGDDELAGAINDDEEPGADDEDNLPKELENSVVRVQVGEDTADVNVETEVHNDVADGELCTVCETPQILSKDDFPLQESCDQEKLQNSKLLTIGNSKSTNFRKGYLTLTSAMKKKNKRAWSAAYRTVRNLIGSRKMTAADWAVVAYIASCKMKTLKSSAMRIVSAFKGSEKLKTMFLTNAKKPITSSVFRFQDEDELTISVSALEAYEEQIGPTTYKQVANNLADKLAAKMESGSRDLQVDMDESELDILLAALGLYEDGDYPTTYRQVANELADRLEGMDIQSSRKSIKSDLNAKGGSELDNQGQPKNQMQPEDKNLGSETGNIDENAQAAANNAAGEHDDNYGKVPKPTTDKTPETTINAPELDYAELSAPINNSIQGVVMRKIGDGIYRVIGTRVSSAKQIAFEKVARPEKGSLKNSCPFNSGSVVSLGNGKAVLLKNSNTAGMLAFYGDFVKSSKKVPYFVSQEQNKGIVIAESKKGEDVFARGEKIWASIQMADMRKKAEQEIRSAVEKDYEIRRKQIKSALETKYKREIESNNQASKKLDDALRDKERTRLFASNQKVADEDAEIKQIMSSRNVDRMASLMGRI